MFYKNLTVSLKKSPFCDIDLVMSLKRNEIVISVISQSRFSDLTK